MRAKVQPVGTDTFEVEASDAGSTRAPVTVGHIIFDTVQSWDSLRALAGNIAAEFDAAGFDVEVLGFRELR